MSQVALHIPGAYNLSMHLPVVIGTVPHRRQYLLQSARVLQDATLEFLGTQFLPAPPPYRESATPPPPIDGLSRVIALVYFSHVLWHLLADPPTYAESLTGAVDIREDDDQGTMGDLTYTPMYTYVYDYRYRPPPAYSEVSFMSALFCIAHNYL
jgi:hypothetical protein